MGGPSPAALGKCPPIAARFGFLSPGLQPCPPLRLAGANAYITATSVITDDNRASPPRAGGAQRRFTHGSSPADAESERRVAGREHVALLRPGRRFLQTAPTGGEGHCRRRRRAGH